MAGLCSRAGTAAEAEAWAGAGSTQTAPAVPKALFKVASGLLGELSPQAPHLAKPND